MGKGQSVRKSKAELLVRESADWFHRGLISAEVSKQLGERYDRQGAFLATLGRWLGIFAVLFLGGGVFLLMAMSGASPLANGVVLLVAAVMSWAVGIRMATSKVNPFPVTGAALVTFGLIALFGALALMLVSYNCLFLISCNSHAIDRLIPTLMLIVAACAAATAYGYALRWPLFLAVLLLFHAMGAMGWYGGRGSYFFNIQHPPSMAMIAALMAVLGYLHRLLEETRIERYSGFGKIMIVFGLIYFNCSLWFMSLGWDWRHSEFRVIWTLGFAAAAVAQIVFGARTRDSTFTGFGVVFLAINLYTQFFERFWDKLSLATFLALAGLGGLFIGYGLEFMGRRRSTSSKTEVTG